MSDQNPYSKIEVCRSEYEKAEKVVEIQMKNFDMNYELWQQYRPNLGAIQAMINALEALKPVVETYYAGTPIDGC